MNEIEIRLLQSLRHSNLRDDFNTQALAASESAHAASETPHAASETAHAASETAHAASEVAADANGSPADRGRAHQGRSATRAGVDLLYGELTEAVIGAAIQVHRWLGPGQLESTYQRALGKELAFCGIRYRAQVPITSRYRGEAVGEFFADFIVEDKIILELKVVSRILAVHRAQVNSYLRATGLQLGLLINFYVPILHMGVKRVLP
ncbi:MAG: GxxExxY protein [Kofleriaceae bacterium]